MAGDFGLERAPQQLTSILRQLDFAVNLRRNGWLIE